MIENFEVKINEELEGFSERELQHLGAEFENYEQLYPHRTTPHGNSPLLY